MQLNHLDLSVPDVAAAAVFFVAGFDFTHLVAKGNDGMAVLTGQDEFVLVLTRLSEESPQSYPRSFHIGFLVNDEDEVMQKHAKLLAFSMYDVSPIRTIRGGPRFYCHVPGGVMVEVGCRVVPDQLQA